MSDLDHARSHLLAAGDAVANGQQWETDAVLSEMHGRLAMAEQLRIANLIQLMNVSEDTACIDAIYMAAQGGGWKLRPEIAEALGIKEEER